MMMWLVLLMIAKWSLKLDQAAHDVLSLHLTMRRDWVTTPTPNIQGIDQHSKLDECNLFIDDLFTKPDVFFFNLNTGLLTTIFFCWMELLNISWR